MSPRSKGTLIAVAGVLFLSFTAILISRLTGFYNLKPLVLAFWRDLLVSIFMFIILLLSRRRLPRMPRSRIPFLVLYGFLLFIFNSVWTYSVPMNGAAVATVLAYGSVGFTVILARLVFREHISFTKVIGVIFSLGGCALVANAVSVEAWNTRPAGIVFGILTGLLYAFYNLAGKRAAAEKMDTWETMLFTFGFASMFLLAANLIPGLPGAAGSLAGLLPDLPTLGWMLLAALAFGPTLFGFTLYNLSMNYLPVSIVNLIGTLEPVFTAVEAYVLLGEVMSLLQVGGSILIIAAVVIVRMSDNAYLKAHPDSPPDPRLFTASQPPDF